MLEKRRCSLVFFIAGFVTVILLMKLNIKILLSLEKSKYSVPFDPDVFIVTFNSYSNDKPTNLFSKSSFNRRKIYPWKNDPTCQHPSVQMAERNSLPKWALTSFPGSGVTWTRQMIEGLTGIYTGSVHVGDPLPFREDQSDENMGIADDPFCGCTIIDKDHEATEGVSDRQQYFDLLYLKEYFKIINITYNYRGILLLRNPMDVIFAHQNHLIVGKFNVAPMEAFRGPQWEELVETVADAWADHAIRWIEQIKQGTVIFYENLLGNDAQLELERLLDAMDFQPRPVDADRMRCTLAHRDKSEYKRSNKTRLPIANHQRVKLMNSIARVQESLRKRKWPLLPLHLYDKHWPSIIESLEK